MTGSTSRTNSSPRTHGCSASPPSSGSESTCLFVCACKSTSHRRETPRVVCMPLSGVMRPSPNQDEAWGKCCLLLLDPDAPQPRSQEHGGDRCGTLGPWLHWLVVNAVGRPETVRLSAHVCMYALWHEGAASTRDSPPVFLLMSSQALPHELHHIRSRRIPRFIAALACVAPSHPVSSWSRARRLWNTWGQRRRRGGTA